MCVRRWWKIWLPLLVVAAICMAVIIKQHITPFQKESEHSMQELAPTKRKYAFDGSISKEVLVNYLSRAVTHAGLLASYPESSTWCFDEDLRMLRNVGAKFIGRAAFAWGTPENMEDHFQLVAERAQKVHEADPEIILQACLFEIVDRNVGKVSIPPWVFEEFNMPVESRNFDYDAMMYEDGRMGDMWGANAAPPDMSRVETRMYFYYRGVRYIQAGIEAIHFGQYYLMNQKDPGNKFWIETLTRLRDYAKKNARRHFLLCDAHDASGGVSMSGNRFMFDFASFPTRPKEIVEEPQKCELSRRYLDSVYDKRKRGITPSGWTTDALPYLIEIDNGGIGPNPGEPSLNSYMAWNYDEITWLALQPEEYRNEWIRYAWNWIRENAPHAYFQFPTRRMIMVQAKSAWKIGDTLLPLEVSQKMKAEARVESLDAQSDVRTVIFSNSMYRANAPSINAPNGFGQEETIKDIWQKDQ